MTDINARIAVIKGWIHQNTSAGHTYWINDEYPRGLTQSPQNSQPGGRVAALVVRLSTSAKVSRMSRLTAKRYL